MAMSPKSKKVLDDLVSKHGKIGGREKYRVLAAKSKKPKMPVKAGKAKWDSSLSC